MFFFLLLRTLLSYNMLVDYACNVRVHECPSRHLELPRLLILSSLNGIPLSPPPLISPTDDHVAFLIS